jgi:hypothetical protein
MTTRNLGKWPRLIVSGRKIPSELAAEIIVRTDSFYFSCNDRHWTRDLYGTLGVALNDYDLVRDLDKEDAAKKRYGVLQLIYLNNHQIASPYIGGPHGWVDWDGIIGCSTFNIGKWPSVEKVLEEWKLIASTWPELEFQSQLIADEGKGEPVVDFHISGGEVRMAEPVEVLEGSATGVREDAFLGIFTQYSSRERGCTLEQFKAALDLVETKLRA